MTPIPAGIANTAVNRDALNLQVINPILTGLAKQFTPEGFAYDQIVNSFPVTTQVGQYPIFDPTYFFAAEGVPGSAIAASVDDRAPTPRIAFKWSTDFYYAKDYRRAVEIGRKEWNQAIAMGDPLKVEWSYTKLLLTRQALEREIRLANKLRATSNGGSFTAATLTPSVKWDAGTTGTPATIQGDLQTASTTVYRQCGKRPNTLVLTREIAMAIANDPTVQDRLKYTVGERIVAEGDRVLPPTLFGFNVIEIDGALVNSAAEGATISLGEVWGNSVRLIYVNPQPMWGIPSTVYAFRAPVTGAAGEVTPAPTLLPGNANGTEPAGGNSAGVVVERWAEFDPPVEIIRAWENVDEKVVAAELGIELTSVITDSHNAY